MIFRKKKYHFNRVTLTYEEIKPDRKKRILDFFLYIVVSLIILSSSGFILNDLLGSPESWYLQGKLSSLESELQVLLDKGHEFSSRLRNKHFTRDNTYRTMLQVDTLSDYVRMAGTGGSSSVRALAISDDPNYKLDILIHMLNHQLSIQSESYEILLLKAREHAMQFSHIPAIQPVSRTDLYSISSDFGVRTDPFYFHQKVHCGLDFVAAEGKSVYATGDGIVTFIQFSRTGYGNEIIIDHSFGFGSRYAHLDTILVTEGQKVKRGQMIGRVGKSGRATGPHLHYEVLYEKKPVNPALYFDSSLTVQEYKQILEMAANKTN